MTRVFTVDRDGYLPIDEPRGPHMSGCDIEDPLACPSSSCSTRTQAALAREQLQPRPRG